MAKKPKKIELNDEANNFIGTGRPEKIMGNGGDDNISGAGGRDRINGGEGNDTLAGGGAADRLVGGAGDDIMAGGAGDDTINATAGNDTVDGGSGDDTVVLSVKFADAVVTKDGDNFVITAGGSTVTVKNVEFFKFTDQTLTADEVVPPPVGVTLTEGADNVTGNVINAPRGFTPGGTDQVNTLNDDDVITGTGADATLNVEFVNDADTGDNSIQPTISGVANIKTNVRTDSDATIDLQDSTGVQNLFVTGVDDFATFTYDNIQDMVKSLNVSDSQADNGGVNFLFDEDIISGDNDSVALNLNNAELDFLSVDPESGDAGIGIEHIALDSKGDNEISELSIEDAQDITVTGDGDLKLGDEDDFTFDGRVEATIYTAGLANVAGSLTKINAAAATGDLEINLGSEVTGVLDDTSGVDVEFSVVGGSGNDTFRLLSGFDTKGDTIDGGTGDNTLQVFSSVANGKITNVQHLDVRAQNDTTSGDVTTAIDVDASLFTGLVDITVRNEGFFDGAGNDSDLTVNLNKLTADLAKNITVLHSTTNSNGIDENTIVANLAADTAADTVGVTIKDGANSEPRFNFELTADSGLLAANKVENITIADSDTESNSVFLTNFAEHTGTLTVTGGKAGQFLNLDTDDGLFDKDLTGTAVDGEDFLDGGGAGSGAIRTVFSKIDASTYLGDLIARVGVVNTDITTGAGNDTIIFDADDLHSGLSISDKVNLGAGNDTVAIDGFFAATVNVGASEWTNFKGVDNIRLVDNDAGGYFLTLTNELVDQTDGGSVINIINDLDVDSDGSAGDTESDATIDARGLAASNFFTYDGAESGESDFASTAIERFILADANINGGSTIDGGFEGFDNEDANDDTIEVRNAAVVTIGDLANISNIGTLEFTNDTAAVQTSVLELDTATIDRLVDTSHKATAAEQEVLTVRAEGNALIPGATTVVNIDLTNVDFTTTAVVLETEDGGFFNVIGGAGPVTFVGGDGDDNFTGSAGDDTISGGQGDDTLGGGDGDDVITGGAGDDTINAGAGADTVTGGAGNDTIDLGFDTDADLIIFNNVTEAVDTVTSFDSGEDTVGIGGVLRTQLDDVFVDGVITSLISTGANIPANVDVLEALFVDFANNVTVDVAEFADLTQVAAEFEDEFALANETVGDDLLFILESANVAGDFAVYKFTSVTADDAIAANELQLIGTFDGTDATVNMGDFEFV